MPKNATVEISAKISAGYHADGFKGTDEVLNELRDLASVRKRCQQIFALAEKDQSKHFKLDIKKLDAVADKVVAVTKASYPDVTKVPYHSRWRHFDQKSVDAMVHDWACDATEKVRRMIDLATVSVLLDAGAGTTWHYVDNNGTTWARSEGLAHATSESVISCLGLHPVR